MNNPQSRAWQKWHEIIRRQQASGLSVAAFCRRSGVAASSLYAWKRRWAAAATPAFVEAKVAEEPAPPAPSAAIELRLGGGRRLRVRRGFDRDLLVQVLAVLEGRP
jgi:transposase-like protein